MLEYLSLEYYVAWGAEIVLMAVLADIIAKYRHYCDFPAFALFVCVSLVKSLGLIAISVVGTPEAYFYAYWIAQVFVISCLFCVVHEVFDSVTERASIISHSAKTMMIRFATVSAVVLVAASLTLSPDSRYPVMEAIVDLQRGLGMAIFMFMAVIVMLARNYSIPWHRRDSGIALGVFLAYSFQTLWPQVSAFLFGHPQQNVYQILLLAFDMLASLIWIYSFIEASHKGDFFRLPPAVKRLRLIRGGKNPKQFSSVA